MGYWQEARTTYFPDMKPETTSADVYQRAAYEAAKLCLKVNVESLRQSTLIADVNGALIGREGQLHTDEVISATAVTIGYRAQMEDATDNTYESLKGLLYVISHVHAQDKLIG